MGTRRLIATAIGMACLVLGACGSDGEGPDVSLPTSVTLPERSTSAPPDTGAIEPPEIEVPEVEVPEVETPEVDTPAPAVPGPEAGSQEGADDATPLWPWLLAGLTVVGLVAFLVSRRSQRRASWQQRTAGAFDDATRIATHLAAVAPEGVAMVAAQDAGQLAGLAATLSALGAQTSDEAQRRALASVHDQVQVLHGVVDGIAMGSVPASPAAFDSLRAQATALHGVAARARAEALPGLGGHGGAHDR